MSGAATAVTQGVVLHARALRENSRVLELLTGEAGRVAAVVRGKAGSVQPFVLLDLAWRGRGELPTLQVAEQQRVFPLTGRALVCGLYLNELVLRLYPREAPIPEALPALLTAYARLAARERADVVLRRAEWALLLPIDSGLEHVDVAELEPAVWYRYEPEMGLEPTAPGRAGAIAGEALAALASGQSVPDNYARPARDFMRALIDHHLAGRALRTRALL
ncbi:MULTISPECIES: DNA repair protein RecO [unclassified Thioalkalivibrio]|uniref:DNA repair protein RecO n=1 Tax=unclassified Thioalkalivibrio TaxID=2621013 RepID=UPI000382DD45|nr:MULTISPECIES: recombination protein O N-terminal domain-containing protein [unclassified Thioalkalivibrio]